MMNETVIGCKAHTQTRKNQALLSKIKLTFKFLLMIMQLIMKLMLKFKSSNQALLSKTKLAGNTYL